MRGTMPGKTAKNFQGKGFSIVDLICSLYLWLVTGSLHWAGIERQKIASAKNAAQSCFLNMGRVMNVIAVTDWKLILWLSFWEQKRYLQTQSPILRAAVRGLGPITDSTTHLNQLATDFQELKHGKIDRH